MQQFFEALMLLCFGLSWPVNLVKSIKARTAKNTSLFFIILILTGYIAGITSKLISKTINYVFCLYVINLVVVSANLVVYFLNKKRDENSANN